MTEIEAKTKWCPMARVIDVQAFNCIGKGNEEQEKARSAVLRPHNREYRNDSNEDYDSTDAIESSAEEKFKCIGSACMMWRAHTGTISKNRLYTTIPGVGPITAENIENFLIESGIVVSDGMPVHGYCGLAGKP